MKCVNYIILSGNSVTIQANALSTFVIDNFENQTLLLDDFMRQ